MQTYKQYYMLMEMQDSKANRANIIRAYGLDQHGGSPENHQQRASELIKLWSTYSPLIKKDQDYGFGQPLDPRDIYSWSKVTPDDKLEALQNLEAMIINLQRMKQRNDSRKQQENDYSVVYKNEHVTVYEPHSEGASCRLGAGTKWCTAATRGTNHFNSYTKEQGVRLFYIIPHGQPKQQPDRFGPQVKFAIAEYPDGRREYFDDEDQPYADEEFEEHVLKRYNIDTTGWLKKYSVVEQLHKACLRLSKLADESTNRIKLSEAQESIMNLVMDMGESNYKDYEAFREKTGYPDRAFLEVSEKHGLTTDAYMFFTTQRSNPPLENVDLGSDTIAVKTNKEFRHLFADALNERTDLSLRGYGEYDHPGGDDDDLWKQVNMTLSYMKHQDRVWDLIDYSKNWTGGNWTELHDLVLDAFMELGPKQFTEGDAGMIHGGLLRFCLLELPDNRFPEMEQYAVEQMQIAARQMGLAKPGGMTLGAPGDNEQMEQWTIKMRKAGWIDFANRYNLFVAGAKATNDKVPYIPNNPSSYEKLFDYPIE